MGRCAAVLALALLGCSLLGCSSGESRYVVKGKLMKGDQPYNFNPDDVKLPKGTKRPPGDNFIIMALVPVGGGTQYGAQVNSDTGEFVVQGDDGKGIKPGMYKVTLTASAGFGQPDLFDGKYTIDNTPLQVEVKPGADLVVTLK